MENTWRKYRRSIDNECKKIENGKESATRESKRERGGGEKLTYIKQNRMDILLYICKTYTHVPFGAYKCFGMNRFNAYKRMYWLISSQCWIHTKKLEHKRKRKWEWTNEYKRKVKKAKVFAKTVLTCCPIFHECSRPYEFYSVPVVVSLYSEMSKKVKNISNM